MEIYSKHCQSQTGRAEILRECSSHTMCHVSRVTCHVSRVTCHVSRVTCHMSHVTCHMSKKMSYSEEKNKNKKLFLYTTKNIGQSGGASQWRVCYQRGLPRLVLTDPV